MRPRRSPRIKRARSEPTRPGEELEHVGHFRHTGGPWQLVAPHLADALAVITLARSVERDGDLLRHTDRAREEHRRFTVRSSRSGRRCAGCKTAPVRACDPNSEASGGNPRAACLRVSRGRVKSAKAIDLRKAVVIARREACLLRRKAQAPHRAEHADPVHRRRVLVTRRVRRARRDATSTVRRLFSTANPLDISAASASAPTASARRIARSLRRIRFGAGPCRAPGSARSGR